MKKAYVTVYFTLVISVSMAFILTLYKGIRENAARSRAREVMQISMDSAFAEYNRYLWENYKLIFVDSGYDSEVNSAILAEDHFTECMNKNFDEGGSAVLGERDLLNLTCRGTEFDKIRFATDQSGAAIKKQATEYMRYKTKIEYISDLYSGLQDYSEKVCDIEEYKELFESSKEKLGDNSQAVYSEIGMSENQMFIDEDGELSIVSFLRLVVSDSSAVSVTEMNKDALYTEREHNEGNYGVTNSITFLEKALYREYMLEVCSNYLNDKPNSCMSYEVEYLISGKTEDDKNLESVVFKILLAREASNLISFENDSIKKGEVNATAIVISGILLNPGLIEPIKALLTAIWVHLESMNDVRAILNGKKRPLIKDRSEWKTGLSFSSLFGSDEDEGKGLGYEDYLRMFLVLESDDTLTDRFINLVELNVRENTDNSSFRMDLCFDASEVTSYVECGNGGNYVITRVKDVEDY